MDLESLSIDELIALYAADDELVRLRAALELKSREEDILPRVLALVSDELPEVRATAVYTLGQMATQAEADQEYYEDLPELREKGSAVMATLPVVQDRFARDPDAGVRYHAFKALAFYNAIDVALATAALDDRDPRIRAVAPFSLCRLDPTSPAAARGFAAILLAPEEPGSNGWQESAMMLERMGEHAAPALPALAARLEDDTIDRDLRVSLVDAVKAIGTAEARRLLDAAGVYD